MTGLVYLVVVTVLLEQAVWCQASCQSPFIPVPGFSNMCYMNVPSGTGNGHAYCASYSAQYQQSQNICYKITGPGGIFMEPPLGCCSSGGLPGR